MTFAVPQAGAATQGDLAGSGAATQVLDLGTGRSGIPPARVSFTAVGATRPNGSLISLSPSRFVFTGAHGHTLRLRLEVANFGNSSARINLSTTALGAGDTPSTFARPARDRQDARWLRPALTAVTVPSMQVAIIPVDVSIPLDARPGLHALALVATRRIEQPASTTDGTTRISLRAALAAQALITVPGEVRLDASLTSVDAPRVVVRGWRAPTFRTLLRNEGDALVQGRPELRTGSFGGIASSRIKASPVTVLPDGSRSIAVRWQDLPWIGWFHPTIVLDCKSGCPMQEVTVSYPTVYVLPPWWFIALLVVTALLPPALRMRRGRRKP